MGSRGGRYSGCGATLKKKKKSKGQGCPLAHALLHDPLPRGREEMCGVFSSPHCLPTPTSCQRRPAPSLRVRGWVLLEGEE